MEYQDCLYQYQFKGALETPGVSLQAREADQSTVPGILFNLTPQQLCLPHLSHAPMTAQMSAFINSMRNQHGSLHHTVWFICDNPAAINTLAPTKYRFQIPSFSNDPLPQPIYIQLISIQLIYIIPTIHSLFKLFKYSILNITQ
jgi:hypothetical protein